MPADSCSGISVEGFAALEVGGGRTNGKRERRVDNVQIRNGQLDLSRRGLRTAATNRDKRSGRLPRRESAPPLWSVLGSWVKPCGTRLVIRKGRKGPYACPISVD